MYIQKKATPRDNVIRINSEKDIPEFLKDTIRVENDHLVCLSAEGYGTPPLGSVIGFDKNAPTVTGKGAWPMGPDSYTEKDGVFYSAQEVREAHDITPPYSIETNWGTQTLKEGESGYLITRPNGNQYILTSGTSSIDDYMVCTRDGEDIISLNEFEEIRNDAEIHVNSSDELYEGILMTRKNERSFEYNEELEEEKLRRY